MVRRDVCPFVQQKFKHTLEMVLRDQNFDAARTYVVGEVARLLRGEVQLADLIVTKALRGDYKHNKLPHVKVAEKLEARGGAGARPRIGDRVPYVYIPMSSLPPRKSNEPKYTQSDCAEDPAFVIEHDLTPDYMWYLEHSLMTPVIDMFELDLSSSKRKCKLMFEEVILRSQRFQMIDDFFKRRKS